MEERVRFRIAAAVSFVLGLFLFLTQTRSSGTAPEVFRLSAEASGVTWAALTLIIISVALLIISFGAGKEKGSAV